MNDDCAGCGAPLAADQRYCLGCGARRGSLPPAIAALFGPDRGAAAPPPPQQPPAARADSSPTAYPAWLPSPSAAATAVMLLLAFGVVIGSLTDGAARSAGVSTFLVEMPVADGEPVEPAEGAVEVPAPEPAPEVVVPVEETFAEPLPPEEEALPELPEEELPEEFFPESTGPPEVKHVFLIVLGENGFEESFGEAAEAPYLSKRLREQGVLLSNYYAVAPSDLANQVALLSGQGPTPESAQNCLNYADLVPGTVSAEGQAEGDGCVYPDAVETLPDQLEAADLTWRAYAEDIGSSPDQPPTCRHPDPGSPDLKREATPGDAYVTWRNPFVYFRSITDDEEFECGENVVGIDRLAADLKAAKKTPTLSYLIPGLCHDGGAEPCEPEQTLVGPRETEEFLREVVPLITESPAYEDGGLIAITSSLAPQTGEGADSAACCVYPQFPNLPPGPEEEITGPTKASGGGGRVGMLLISPFVEPGSVNEGYYNHFTMLLTIGELLGLPPLGYAREPALAALGEAVFNAAPETEAEGDTDSGAHGDAGASAWLDLSWLNRRR